VARRRYGKPSPAISTAGQAAQPRNPSGDESLAQELQPRSEYGEPPPEPAQPQATSDPAQHYDISGLKAQIDQHRQYAQPDPLDQYLNTYFAGALPHERQWLRGNVHYLQNAMLVHHAAQIALQRGIPRESPEFLHFVGQLLDQHYAASQVQPAPAPMPLMPPTTHVDLEKVETPAGEPESEHMDAHFVSAPVSRGDSGHSIDPQLTPSQIRLTPEERDLCALNKISETEYAKGKLKLAKQKAAKIRD
jgi:hypothetical protein